MQLRAIPFLGLAAALLAAAPVHAAQCPRGTLTGQVTYVRGGSSAVTDMLRDLRPPAALPFEVRFETPPGDQAQVDFAQFQVAFADEPGVTRIVWLFSLVLGYSRRLWARFVLHQDLQTVLRCHSPPAPRSTACRARSCMTG
jgi:hypothetical protein